MSDIISISGITISKNAIQIGNEKIFLNFGEIHYFRLKPNEWEERLAKIKELGLNGVSTYIPWNFHEFKKGNLDVISEAKNIDNFFHQCENKGLYIIVKPGPWIGADIINGGIPQWLIDNYQKILALDYEHNFIKGESKEYIPISYLSPTYQKYVELYINQIAPKIQKHLYPHGGVILLQPDNNINFCARTGLFDVDYNYVSIEFYQSFLKNKYKDISSLNKLYNTNFLDFNLIKAPTKKDFDDTVLNLKDFSKKGEFLRLLDWMEAKENIIEEYTSQICYFFRKNKLLIPYFVNTIEDSSPTNIRKQSEAYKTGILVSQDWFFDEINLEKNNHIKLESMVEILKAQNKYLPFISRLQSGHYLKKIGENQTHILLRLALGHGIKALNHYIVAGGTNPIEQDINFSAVSESNGFNGEKHIIDKNGNDYDYGAAIGQLGQKNPRFEVVELFSKYISMNGKKLINSSKVYDNVSLMYYHPYTRIKFDTTKLGTKFDLRELSQDSIASQQTYLYQIKESLSKSGIIYDVVDPEIENIEDILQRKIIIACFCNFMDTKSKVRLRKFVKNGGILLSFGEIPSYNEKYIEDNELSILYEAKIQDIKQIEKLYLFKEEISNKNKVFTYEVENLDNEDIIANYTENNKSRIIGFKKKIGEGMIFHLGYFPDGDSNLFEKILKNIGLEYRKTIKPDKLLVLRQKGENGEEFISSINLSNESLKNINITLNDAINLINHTNIFNISKLTIPPRSALQWTYNRKINEYATIIFCNSEIIYDKTISRLEPTLHKINGYHFKNSKNIIKILLHKVPIKIIHKTKDISKKVKKTSNKMGMFLEEVASLESDEIKNYVFTAFYSEDFEISLSFGDNKKEPSDKIELHLLERESWDD